MNSVDHMKHLIQLVESAEQLDEGTKSKMAAIGLAGLIVGANLPDDPSVIPYSDFGNPSSSSPQYNRTADKFKIESWNSVYHGNMASMAYQVNLNIIEPVRLVCRLYNSSNRVIGQTRPTKFSTGWKSITIDNTTGIDGVKVVCQEV